MAEGGQEIPEEVNGRSSISSVNSTNYLMLQKIVIDVGTITLRHLLQYLATSGPNRGDINHFFEFLNIREVRCKIFQLTGKRKTKTECCICGNNRFRNILRDRQWEQLYENIVIRNCNNVNMSSSNEAHCCVYEAVMGVLDKLDISLMSCILTNVSNLKKNQLVMDMITKLKEHRDFMAHLTSTEIPNDEFNNRCEDLRRTLMDLVSVTGDDNMAKRVLSEINDIRAKQIAQQEIARMLQFVEEYKQIESPVMEERKSYTTSDEKEKVQSHPNVSQETKNFKEKVSAMEKIEQKLKDYAQALYINAHKEKQSTSTAVKENVSSVQNVRQEKGVVNEKLKTIQDKVVEMERKLSDLAQALYIKAQGDLPKEVQPLLSGTRDMVTSQVLSERRNVLAMEFGQTYSSFAFSSDASGDPLVGMLFSRLLSNKTATAILLDEKDNFTFFGCEAEEQYARIMESDKKEKYHYFKSFPTVLRSCEKHGRNPSLKDEGGMSFDAQRVFALSIEYFVDMLLLELESGPLGISMDDVNFVITIPAVSGETASQFVIDAAKKAGIDNDQVITVLEPVAASVYCQRADSYAKENECFQPAVGDMYLVVDLGGDSTKITVHTKAVEDGHDSVKSVTHGPCGGNSINEQFMKILEDALGTNVLDLLKKKNAESYLNLFRQFEMAKRKFRSDSLKIEILFPQVLDDICKNEYDRTVSEAFTDSEYGKWISVSGQKLIMEGEQFQQLFRPTLNEVKNFTKDVLSKDENKDIRSILMIGGFSRCDLVKKEIVDEFTSQRVFIPKDPDLAILKGAVFYGRLPYTLRGKIHQCTFGIQNWPKFDSKKHPNERKVMIGNNAHCKGSFSTFAQKGRRVEVGTICRKFFLALEPDADSLVCEIYASHKPYPEFTSECILQGTIEIKLPKLKPENLIIEESFYFGETEMFVEARDIYLTPYKVDCSYQMRIET